MWCHQRNPGISRKVFSSFLAPRILVLLAASFAENLSPMGRKFVFVRFFKVDLSQRQFIRRTHFEVELFWKLNFEIGKFQKVIWIRSLGRSSGSIFVQKMQDGTKNGKKISPNFGWILAEALRIMFYDTWRWNFESKFLRAAGQITRFCDLFWGKIRLILDALLE